MTADLSADLPVTAHRGKVRTERPGHGAGEAESVDGSHVVLSLVAQDLAQVVQVAPIVRHIDATVVVR